MQVDLYNGRETVVVLLLFLLQSVPVLRWGRGGGISPQIAARPPNFSRTLKHTAVDGLSEKIGKSDATRCQILRLKCTKFNFHWGSTPGL